MAQTTDSAEAVIVPAGTLSMQSAPTWNWMAKLAAVWLCGLAILVIRLLAARLMLWSSERRGKVISVGGLASVDCKLCSKPVARVLPLSADVGDANGALISVFKEALSELRISQSVSLMLHPDRPIPIVWGLGKAHLMLPESARDWTTEQQKSVLLHELAHVKRRDTWTQLLAQIACAIYWFNPLVWFAAWRLHVERERACDDLVLSSGVAASAYAAVACGDMGDIVAVDSGVWTGHGAALFTGRAASGGAVPRIQSEIAGKDSAGAERTAGLMLAIANSID